MIHAFLKVTNLGQNTIEVLRLTSQWVTISNMNSLNFKISLNFFIYHK